MGIWPEGKHGVVTTWHWKLNIKKYWISTYPSELHTNLFTKAPKTKQLTKLYCVIIIDSCCVSTSVLVIYCVHPVYVKAWEPGYDNLNNKQEIQQSAAALPLLFVLETSDCTGATGHIDPMSGRNLVKLSLNKLRTQLHQLTAVCKRGFSMQQKILSKGRMWSRSEHKEQRWRQTVFSSDGRVAAAATLCVWEADSRGSVGWIGPAVMCVDPLLRWQTADCWMCVVAHWGLTVTTDQSGPMINRESVMCSGTKTQRADWQ